MMDAHGRPGGVQTTELRATSDDQPKEELGIQTDETSQTVSLNTSQAAQQLSVDSRTVRRYIVEGIRSTGGTILRLEARQVRTNRGPEWQIYQTDLEAFMRERDRAATEGQAAGQVMRPAEESQALTTSVQLLATELERRSQALTQAQQTIERLALEAGRQTGRSEELERQLNTLHGRVKELEEERDQWKQKAEASRPQTPRRIRLLSWRKEGEA